MVLPEPEARSGAAELGAQLALDAVSERREGAFKRLVVLARIAEEPDEFRKFS
jgi:hypothetical protein